MEKPDDVAEILRRLSSTPEGELLAYQISFDLYENATQQFIQQIEKAFIDQEEEKKPTPEGAEVEIELPEQEVKKTSELNETFVQNLRKILRGEETIKHLMQFLIKNNHTDMLILKQIKDSVRMATTHNATVIANGLMHVGTTCDDFLRWVILAKYL